MGNKGKGGGKGPNTGCWVCQGPHYASYCPQAKSKGKGKASPAYGLVEEEYDWDWIQPASVNPPSEVRQLSSLRIVQRKPVDIQNSFQSLDTKETESPSRSLDDPASLMGTQDIRERIGASKFVGEPASLMGTQGTRERTEVEPSQSRSLLTAWE